MIQSKVTRALRLHCVDGTSCRAPALTREGRVEEEIPSARMSRRERLNVTNTVHLFYDCWTIEMSNCMERDWLKEAWWASVPPFLQHKYDSWPGNRLLSGSSWPPVEMTIGYENVSVIHLIDRVRYVMMWPRITRIRSYFGWRRQQSACRAVHAVGYKDVPSGSCGPNHACDSVNTCMSTEEPTERTSMRRRVSHTQTVAIDT
jgi:hypothetical protein